MSDATQKGDRVALPVGAYETRANGWYGLWGLIATEGALFVFLLFSYYYLLFHAREPWPPMEMPKFNLSGPGSAILWSSSGVIWVAERLVKKSRRVLASLLTALTLVMGIVFLGIQVEEWAAKPFDFGGSAYASLFFTITGFHMAHVLVGVVILLAMLVWTVMGYFNENRNTVYSIGAAYWHFVDIVWVFVFATFYVSPYVLR